MTLEFKKYPENIPPPYDGDKSETISNRLLVKAEWRAWATRYYIRTYLIDEERFYDIDNAEIMTEDFRVYEWAILPKI